MSALYRLLLYLYPARWRREYGDEMVFVFRETQAEACRRSLAARAAFCLREVTGLLGGALHEHLRFFSNSSPFASRRFTMRSEFRFPKSATFLMCIILGGVILAIEKARSIQASIPYSNPYVPPIRPLPTSFPQTIGLMFAAVYVGAIIGWAVLFAMRRSGVHRLLALDPDVRQK